MKRNPVVFQDWTKNPALLQQKIYEVLKDIIPDQTHVNKLLDNNALEKYWKRAFTHSSADPDNNYELLEAYGDKTMDYCLTLYFRRAFGDENLDAQKLNYIKREYISGPFQAALTRNLGLDAYIYYNPKIDLKRNIEEDVLEAFFGALNCLADDTLGPGMGFLYCNNLFTKIYNSANIDLTKIKKDDKTVLKELFEAKYNDKNVPYITIQSTQPQYGILQSEVKTLDGRSLGIAYGQTKDEAELKASTLALKTADLGITPESAEKEKYEKSLQMMPIYEKEYHRTEQAVALLNEQSRLNGKAPIVSFTIKQIKAKDRLFTYSLEVAFRQLDNSVLWRSFMTKSGNNPTQTKIDLVREFADSMGIPK